MRPRGLVMLTISCSLDKPGNRMMAEVRKALSTSVSVSVWICGVGDYNT